MQFASLGSGSKGNATLIRHGETCLMLDCGFSLRETEQRLERLGYGAETLTALLLTHEHSDHIRGAGPLARKYDLPVWGTRGTLAHPGLGRLPHTVPIDVHRALQIKTIQVQPYPVPHDAREPCQFVFSAGEKRLGVLTDVGASTTHIEKVLSGCDALLLECNHDEQMLAQGPYPPSLKQRVGGNFGHLSNRQAADLLARLDNSRLRHLVIAHVSEQNNSSKLARQALSEVLQCEHDWVGISLQQEGLDWREL